MIDPGAALKTFIYLISSSLLYPVLILLSGLTLVTVLMIGSFVAEWLERVRLKPCPPAELPVRLAAGEAAAGISQRVRDYILALRRICRDDQAEVMVENLLQDSTLRFWKRMDRLRILVRVAPSLGLIGTLIPMGTGLAALGQGDLTRLTGDLVIAFTTTVVGLAIGTTAFFLYTIRRRWLEEDVKNMELATEMIMSAAGASIPVAAATEKKDYEVFTAAAQ